MKIMPTNISNQLNIRNAKLEQSQSQKPLLTAVPVRETNKHADNPAVINDIRISANKYEYTIEDAKKAPQSDKINWERLEKEFGKLEMGFSERESFPVEDFEQRMDFAASRYAVLKDRIINTSSLSEKKADLGKADRIAQRAVDRMKESYASFMMDELGNTGLSSMIKASIDAIFDAKTNQFARAIRKNPEYAQISDEQDKWLQNDDAYMASQLRKNTRITGEQTVRLFSMDELKAAGSAAIQFSSLRDKEVYTKLSEEEMGMDLSILGMQTEYLIDKSNMKPEMAQAVRKAQQGFMNDYLDAQDGGWQLAVESDRYGMTKPQTLDRGAVQRQYDHTMKVYSKTEDFVDAINEGAKQALKSYKGKYGKEAYAENGRYSEQNYEDLTHFFDRESSELSALGYIEESSTYEKYLTVIGDFRETVDQGAFGSVNFDFQPWGMKEANPEGTLSYEEYFQKIDVRA